MAVLNIIGFSMFALAAAGEAHDSAMALANLKNTGYRSVTFTVACHKGDYDQPMNDKQTTLIVGADQRAVQEITVSWDMEPTTYTVDLGECERLVFFLKCGLEDYNSHEYAIYDITLSK